jgi:hypothetical protein
LFFLKNLIYLTRWKEEVLMYIFRVKLWKYTKWKTKQRWEDDIKNGVVFNLIGSGSKSEWMSNEDFFGRHIEMATEGGRGGRISTPIIFLQCAAVQEPVVCSVVLTRTWVAQHEQPKSLLLFPFATVSV